MNNDDRDLVEDFFAGEREHITAHDGNDLHWQSIVRKARTQRRSRFVSYAAGVAAAALVIGGVTYGAGLRDSGPALTVADGRATAAPSTPGAVSMGQAIPGASASADTSVTQLAPVPKNFVAVSMSNVGGGNIFVLGSSCGDGAGARCPVLIGSMDNGRTWHLISYVKGGSDPASTPGRDPSAGNGVTQVRFANAKVGWVFRGDIQYTTDGGKTFRPYGHLGQTVIDVETDGEQVIVTSADGCASAQCGARHVARASINDSGAITEVGTGATGGALEDLQVVFDAKVPYVSPRWKSAPTSGFEPQRITASGLEPLGGLGGACGSPSEQDVIATADPAGGLFAFCATPGAAMGSIGMAVFRSNNQGSSWAAASSNALIVVNSGPRSFAATSSKDVLAASAGNQDTHGSLQVSHDGGKSWHSPGSPPPMPTKGWAWVGAPGGRTFYAISGDAVPAFWRSDDSGETWTKVGLTS